MPGYLLGKLKRSLGCLGAVGGTLSFDPCGGNKAGRDCSCKSWLERPHHLDHFFVTGCDTSQQGVSGANGGDKGMAFIQLLDLAIG